MTDFPERLRLRDTKLHDDLGGAGQRIYTTAGQGYEKVNYVRGDLFESLADEHSRMRNVLIRIKGQCEIEMAGDRNSAFKYIAMLADSVLLRASEGQSDE